MAPDPLNTQLRTWAPSSSPSHTPHILCWSPCPIILLLKYLTDLCLPLPPHGNHPKFRSAPFVPSLLRCLLSHLASWESIPTWLPDSFFHNTNLISCLIPLKPFDKSPNVFEIAFKRLSICNKSFHSLAFFFTPHLAAPNCDPCWPCSLSVRPLPSHRLFLLPQNASPPIFTDLIPPCSSQLSILGVTSNRQTP